MSEVPSGWFPYPKNTSNRVADSGDRFPVQIISRASVATGFPYHTVYHTGYIVADGSRPIVQIPCSCRGDCLIPVQKKSHGNRYPVQIKPSCTVMIDRRTIKYRGRRFPSQSVRAVPWYNLFPYNTIYRSDRFPSQRYRVFPR